MKKEAMVAVRLTAEKRTKFKIKLLEEGTSAQEVLEKAIDNFLKNEKKKETKNAK